MFSTSSLPVAVINDDPVLIDSSIGVADEQIRNSHEIENSISSPQHAPLAVRAEGSPAGVANVQAHSIAETQTTFWSAQSVVWSMFTESTGFRSIPGATWKEDLCRSMNSGFGPGAPRNENYRGVQEGRERGGYLPSLRGVGRLGTGAIPVPPGLANAISYQMRAAREEEENDEEIEEARVPNQTQMLAGHN